MDNWQTECVVIGGGVIGLAVARELQEAGHETYLIEKENVTGSGISSRSSEVIHAGIYYPPGSLKARLCAEGREMLYDYCHANSIPHRACSKLIVASGEQAKKLDEIEANARVNGVNNLQRLGASEIKALEPEVCGKAGIFSPSTGIIDSHAYMESLKKDFLRVGGHIVLQTPLEGWKISENAIELQLGGKEPCAVRAKAVVNAAGLGAIPLLSKLSGFPPAHIPKAYYAKGNYFTLSGKSPFTHLVYPVPEPGGLGVHATLDMSGACRFGPDVEWVKDPSQLQVNPARADSFYKAIRSYWPGLEDGRLQPGYAGIRPKRVPASAPAADFLIQDDKIHGARGLTNLLGIESPGLTSSLAIAAYVRGRLFS